jgi:hypothetical protein
MSKWIGCQTVSCQNDRCHDGCIRLAALQSLTKDPPSTLDEPDEDWEVVVKMRRIARAALSDTSQLGNSK